ncbi:MAG: nuclear transport factor 2 family protein [Cyanobacteria bacterium J06642_2]
MSASKNRIAWLSSTLLLVPLMQFSRVPPAAIAGQAPQSEVVVEGEEATLSEEDVRQVFDQVIEAWTTPNPDLLVDVYAEDGEFVLPGEVFSGKDAIRELATAYTADHEIAVDLKRVVVVGNFAFAEWVWNDTDKASGETSQFDEAVVVDFEDGKVKRWREYIDADTPKNR